MYHGNYAELSCKELREMFFRSELKHEKMSEEDYSTLIELELEEPDPNMELIKFCSDGLARFEEYKELDKINIDIDLLIKKHGKTHAISLKIALIATIIVIATLATQIISLALGFNIFKYLFGWEKEVLVITPTSDENTITSTDIYIETDEPIRYAIENETQIPDILSDYCNVFKNMDFQFSEGKYLKDKNSISIMALFVKDDVNLQIRVLRNVASDIEKDNEYYEEYSHNNKTYRIFKNLEYFMVIWQDDEYIYHLNVNLPIDKVKAITNKF